VVSAASASTLNEPTAQTPTQLLLTSLSSPFTEIAELESILLRVLAVFDAVPLAFKTIPNVENELHSNDVARVIPTIHHILLNDILPTWLTFLREAGDDELVKELFCPSPHVAHRKNIPLPSHRLGIHCRVVASALVTLLSHLHTFNPKDPGPAALLAFSVSTLGDIVSSYPMDLVYDDLFSDDVRVNPREYDLRTQEWEDYVRTACSVPGKVANALHGQNGIVPKEILEYGSVTYIYMSLAAHLKFTRVYFSNVCVCMEAMIFRLSQKPSTSATLS
jgi:hypothetical protein